MEFNKLAKYSNILYKWNSRNRHLCRNIPYFWNSINRATLPIFGIPLVMTSFTFWNSLDFGLALSKVQYCVYFSPLFFPFFSSFYPLYEYNSKLVLGKVGFAVLCFSQLNGMDGLYYLPALCRYYYYCNTNTARSFWAMHSFSICTIDYSTYFRVCKVFIASKCCILIIIIEFDCI